MVAGLAVYLAGTVVAMLAQNILTVYRGGIAQGLGSACSVAVGRPMLPLCVRHRPGAGHGVAWCAAAPMFAGPMFIFNTSFAGG